ncbi:hypothetical protein BAE44_0015469 [Dichanthelium oligosanthes]|uniref:DUF7771 domain-containing protein n=1 Tax=Dichanthelium oligosanthes TaxID=888268 RepID=A0A1E5VEH1_9POAL|nr:hypothetical protein BAE44_0015469 [Dichanthelium oligosanthes]
MARLAAVAVALAAIAAVAGASESFYASVENHLPARGMNLVCQAIGGRFLTELSVVPRGRVPHGKAGRRIAELMVEDGRSGRVRCNWSYAGNYVAGLTLFDSRWPEAKKCQNPGGEGLCRVVFEHDAVFLKTADDGGLRVIGDLPVKQCRRHWLLFSTECSYPDHPHPYAGRRLGNAFEYFAI